MSDTRSYMLKTILDRSRLFEFARGRGFPLRDVDVGYVVHCLLRSLFCEKAPQPFSWTEVRNGIQVLGYCEFPAVVLLEHARAIADPVAWSTCRVSETLSKPMPSEFPAGAEYGFEVRICPVVRKSSDGPRHRKGAEVDVFLSRCWQAGEGVPVSREATYREWLVTQLGSSGAASIVETRMTAFRRLRVARSTHAAEARTRTVERPDALWSGVLRVEDPAAFAALLRRGIGRHRAFGFGMLLLKPRRPHMC